MGAVKHLVQSAETVEKLLSLQQRSASVANYSIQLCILPANSRWNDATLQGVYIKGLGQELKDDLAAHDDSPDLDKSQNAP